MAADVDEAIQDLAQFEPDPDGQGSTDPDVAAAGPSDDPDDPQWIVWTDAEGEVAWAAAELGQIGAIWHV